MDKYQAKYIDHQLKKKEVLKKLIEERHSTRVFSDKEVPLNLIKQIENSLQYIPSSCNRKAVSLKLISSRDDKSLLGGLLVGGVGWVQNADKIFLLVANMEAYKENLDFMPYLDAGVIVYHLYLICQLLGLKGCFINPNVRKENKEFFDKRFLDKNELFCGAMAIGY